ncbi:SsgA family sporulation/cell division regulator [Kitasatospora sp. NPDC057223]|uniref:SsgA family sporulation/cell division regulator n=1 Tax=Kitasatospora sp. NPDC057223 TaxID=3346055 RepID=UPI0036392C56
MTDEDTPRVPPQRTGARGCTTALELQVLVCPGLSVPVAALLRYHPAEPYSVHLDNHVDLTTPVTWVFARELLAAGLDGRTGTGDVSVHPGAGDAPDALFIVLGGEEGTVVLRAQASQVRSFLADTERLVPFGSEHEHLDLDGLLRRLLGGGPPPPEP